MKQIYSKVKLIVILLNSAKVSNSNAFAYFSIINLAYAALK